MSNEELIPAARGGDCDALESLYNRNRGLMGRAIKHFFGVAEKDDLEQQGFIILTEAVREYREESGAFSSYYYKRLLWGFSRYLFHTDNKGLSNAAFTLLNKYRRFERDYLQGIGRKPTEKETVFFLKLSDKQKKLLDTALAVANPVSFSAMIDDDGRTLGEVVADPCDHYEELEERLDRERDAARVREAVEKLPESEREMIKARYFDGIPRTEIAARNNIPVTTVGRILDRGQQQLRRDGALCRIAKERGFSSQVFHGGLKSFQNSGLSSVEREAFNRLELLETV